MKKFSFCIEIPYLDFENKIVFKEYLNMYLIFTKYYTRKMPRL